MPPAVHHFTPVWQLYEPQQSFRSKQYAPPRKRKRLSQPEDDSDNDSEIESTELPVHSRDTKDPHRVAGWPQNVPLPGSSFPHSPGPKPRKHFSGPTTLQKELAELKPPLYVPPPDEQDSVTSLRRHHLNVLTTIMHTSLLRGDFVRAGRAWGMILRTDVAGLPVDLRTHGRWGIGAEILLRQSFTKDQEDEAPIFSDEGFEAAKDYYERLILQFPFQKTNPHAISSLTFYPAMFGLCIYEIQQKCTRALKRLQSTSPDPDASEDIQDQSGIEDVTAIKRSELESATSLASRMDELMLSPPFDTDPPLLQLRISVALWLVDLNIAVAESEDEQDPNREKAENERDRAKRCLERMKIEGVEAPEMITQVFA